MAAPSPDGAPRRRAGYLKLLALVTIIAGAFVAARSLGLPGVTEPDRLSGAVRALRDRDHVAPAFVAAYALATALGLPGSVLTIAGGAIFGFKLGALLNWMGASVGAALAYALARSLGTDAVHRLLGSRVPRLDAFTGRHGFLTVLRLRLVPVVPFNLLNFGAGLAGVRFRDYFLATLIGLIPGTLVYTYFADAMLAGAAGARNDALVRLLIAGGLLLLLSFLPAIARKAGWLRSGLPAALLLLLLVPTTAHAQGQRFDHSAFDALLRRHVANGLVDYDAFERAPEFPRYLAALHAADLAGMTDAERLAFWINMYNAYTIQLANAHGERRSIRDINKSFGFLKLKGPWGEPIVRAAARTVTMDDVEHRIIRREFQEPRIRFALVCAAMGCPPPRGEAYTADRLEAQLEEQGRIFLTASPEKNRVDVPGRTVHVSMIFDYYKKDFGGRDASVGR